MAAQGWHLSEVKLTRYTFVAGEPKQTVYRLDYKATGESDFDEYRDLFESAGWRYVTRMQDWIYFAWDGEPAQAAEIYTDNQSKVAKYTSLQRMLLTTGLLLYSPLLLLSISGENGLQNVLWGLVPITALHAYTLVRVSQVKQRLQQQPTE